MFAFSRNLRGLTMLPQSISVDLLLTDCETAALLQAGVSTFHRCMAKGLVRKPLKLGGTSRWAHRIS